ncbi:MAG: OmpA family protein [Polyangiales bacterium]
MLPRLSSARLLVTAVALGALAAPGVASAQEGASRFALRGEVGAGLVVNDTLRQRLSYDSAVVQVTGRLAFNVVNWLSLQLSVHNGFYLTSQTGSATGRTLAFQGGLRVEPELGRVGRLWVDGNAGLVLTGDQRQFGFDAGLGFEFRLASWFGLGPYGRFHYVQHDAAVNLAANSTALTFGLSFTLRVPESTPVAAPADRDGDGVLDPDDLCVDVPQGAHPDPARRGCPLGDQDGDGVLDPDDQCVGVAQGEHPDPARAGCPLLDGDGDGIFDRDDACPAVAQGPTPDPARAGCPDGDDDRDGVVNTLDQCRTEPAGFHPDPARAGCPLPDTDHDSVPNPVDACPNQPGAPSADPRRNGCPGLVLIQAGMIRIVRPVFFASGEDTILETSFPVLEAVGTALQATAAIRRVSIHGHTDDVGDDSANMDLSNRRAASVMRWLTEHGVEAGRLEAHGFGETQPVQAIDGLRGRRLRAAQALNRRVEFRILDPQMPEPPPSTQAEPPPSRRHRRHRSRH